MSGEESKEEDCGMTDYDNPMVSLTHTKVKKKRKYQTLKFELLFLTDNLDFSEQHQKVDQL